MKSFRNIRVIPVVVIAIALLAVLKVAGLVIDGGYVFEYRIQPASQAKAEAKGSWAQEMLNFPGGPKSDPSDVTGSITLPEGTEMVMPGDNTQMTVELGKSIDMNEGLRFAIREGGRTVGAGYVVKITK